MKNLKTLLFTLFLSSTAFADTILIPMQVGKCVPYQTVQTKDWLNNTTGTYRNYRLMVSSCDFIEEAVGGYMKKKTHQIIFDLGITEDNDNSAVEANLLSRCEAKREALLSEKQPNYPCSLR